MLARQKRGQSASAAAVFLTIIAVVLIGFVVLLPPADRAELLGENVTTTSSADADIEDTVTEKTLLDVNPGRIDFLAQNEIEHPLPVVNIFTKTESKILAEKNIASGKKGVFTEEKTEFPLSIPDLEHTEDVLLNFRVVDVSGSVIVELNGEQIFKAEPGLETTHTVPLPKNSLQESNMITISSSSPGIAFWKTHQVKLDGIKVVADVTSIEAQESKNIFLLSETEVKNLKRMNLKFKPECKFGEVGKLSVVINGNEIYNGVPDCDLTLVPIEFSPDLVYQGENEIVFKTNKGTYLLSHVIVESELKEVDFPTYYFELSNEEYNDVLKSSKRRIRLQIEFVDVVTSKYGNLVFNGITKPFDTKEVSFTIDLSDDIVRGLNALKVKPKKTLEVRQLRVELVK